MARIWTKAQSDAINALDGSVLVSAAAGSGKTAVLTQRVINRLTVGENPTSVDRLLVVTFTRVAAQEMKQRIGDALSELIKKDPTDRKLINQQMLLPTAKICTIDSFCSDLVKENFQALSIAPDFKIADAGELELLSKQAMDITMEQMYQSDETSDFKNLAELLFSGRDDRKTAEMAEKLYHNSISFPFPEKWLDSLCDDFEEDVSIKDSTYGKIILGHITRVLQYCIDISSMVLIRCEGIADYEKAVGKAIADDKAQAEYILERIQSDQPWDEIRRAAFAYNAVRKGSRPKDLSDDTLLTSLEQNRKTVKDELNGIKSFFCCSEEEYRDDMDFLRPMMKALVKTAKLYKKNFDEIKKEKKVADFSDITHRALELLVEETPDGWKSTPLAENLRDNFDEILIDEYQDTNAAQDMLFTAISRDNLFRVGDVKQSIYRFRQANPDIFISLKNAYKPYDKDINEYPAKIVLGNNFRSRKGVTDIINFVFSQIMSASCGDIDYDENEELVFSAGYTEKDEAATELHLVEYDKKSEGISDGNEVQAIYIADLIKEMMKNGHTVKDGDGERPVTYKDIAILMRSTGGGKAVKYADVLRREGVPCFTEMSGEFLTSVEISLAVNILRVIDNPKQDIPLLSVMMSPVFGFTADEISQLRISSRRGDIYSCLMASEDEKVKSFFEKIRYWRNLSVCLRVKELLEEIYSDTALPDVFQATDASGVKRGNLMLLCDYADIYENSGYGSLSGFINFIDRLGDKQRDISGSVGVSEESDCVKIMTIHKSKGLEFPVCIIASCASQFNKSDEKDNLVISQKYGIGVKRRDIDTFRQYETLCQKAVKLGIRNDNISEEMRVLYVAMTRAREKLIMVYANDKIKDKCQNYSAETFAGNTRFSPYACSGAVGYGEWLIKTLLRHPDARSVRDEMDIDHRIELPSSERLKIVYSLFDGYAAEEDSSQVIEKADEDFLSLIKERADFRYKYEALSGIVTKRAASETDKNFIDRDYFASSQPSFMNTSGLTGAAKGVATHTFIQYADYDNARSDPESEIRRLRDKGILSEAEAQAINREALKIFFSSSLFGRIDKSDLVMREKKFTVEVPISEVYEGVEEFGDEMMMIQGIADCAFLEDGKLVVVDYKTDRLDSEDSFREKYTSQVLIYKKALTMATGYEVKETLLYSFHLGKTIKVEG